VQTQNLATPSLLALEGQAGGNVGETPLVLCEYYSAVAKTLLCYQHLSRHQYKAQHCEDCYGQS